MSMNGSGVFNVSSTGQPVVANTLISASVFNAFTADVATALSTALYKDGQQTVTANLPMATYRHTGVGAASATTDYARYDQVQNSASQVLSSVSGADTITANATPTPAAYAAGQTFRFVSAGANTGAATLNVSSLGAKAITKNGTTALVAGDIPSGAMVEVTYDGTRFQLGMVGLKAGDIGVSVQAYDADIPTVSASQGEMEAGTETALRSMSPLRVAQAIAVLGGGGISTIKAGENLADRDLIYHDIFNQRSGGADCWYKVDADATGPVRISPYIGIALAAITSGNNGSAQTSDGPVSGFTSLTDGQPVWASATAGGVTQTAPVIPSTGTQHATRMIGYATSTTAIYFSPHERTIFSARNSAVASAGSITLEHFTDAGALERHPCAYLTSVANATLIAGGTGTTIGDMNAGGGLAAAFDGNTSQSQGASCSKTTSTSGYANSVGKDWGSGNTKTITRFVAYSPTDAAYLGGTTTNFKLQGSTDNFSSSIVDLTSPIATGSGSAQVIDTTSGITTSTAYRYHRLILEGNGSNTIAVAELLLYEGSGTRSEPIIVSSESISSGATDKVTCRFDDGADANSDTKTTFINRTNGTRDLVVDVEI